MNARVLITALLLFTSGVTLAQGGGLGYGNVKQHMPAAQWVQTNGQQPTIIPLGPIDKFNTSIRSESMVDTDHYRHSYDGQAKGLAGKNDVVAQRPNFIRYLRRNA